MMAHNTMALSRGKLMVQLTIAKQKEKTDQESDIFLSKGDNRRASPSFLVQVEHDSAENIDECDFNLEAENQHIHPETETNKSSIVDNTGAGTGTNFSNNTVPYEFVLKDQSKKVMERFGQSTSVDDEDPQSSYNADTKMDGRYSVNTLQTSPSTPDDGVSSEFVVSVNPKNPTKVTILRSSIKKYNISPKDSSESDYYDSDLDPEFNYTLAKKSTTSSSNESHGESTSSSESCSEPPSSSVPNNEDEIINNSEIEKRVGKKRKAKPNEWNVKKSKSYRNLGLKYTSANTGKSFNARKMRPPCSDKCKFKCKTKFNEIQRQQIFENYWSLGDLHKQRSYIAASMTTIKPKYRYSSTVNYRKLNNAFHFEINNVRARVCKEFYKATLDINDRPIRTVLEKKSNTGIIAEDFRGKHCNHPTVGTEIKDGARKHIKSIPRIESHYLRAQTSREYIDGGKTLAEIWRDYQRNCIDADQPCVNLVMFSKIFNEEFNIGFFVPKKDQCELCVAYQNAEGEDKYNLKHKFEVHQREKELSRQEKNEDKAKSNQQYVVAVYDLQAVLPTPRGDVSLFYYKSKLNTYNLTISELKTGRTECYLWHEGEGNRGVQEIASCVWKFIEKIVNNLGDVGSVDLVFYSDNCSGQQKNKFMVATYTYAVMKFPQINSITHKYLITGHTQNEGDSVHSTVERQIKRSLKSGPIYVPSQYAQIIRIAKKRGEPYHVNELTHNDFYAIKDLTDQLKLAFAKIKITSVKIFKIEKNRIDKFLFKTSYSESQFQETDMLSRKRNVPFKLLDLKPAYSNRIKIKDNKKSDLLSLIQSNHIPRFYSNFYNNLL